MSIINFFRKKKYQTAFVEPDEIFLDTKNLPQFDQQQFEGRIEKPITKQTLQLVKFFFLFTLLIFSIRLFTMQLINGSTYFKLSQENRLDHEPLFAERGVIYDRNNIELAWNEAPKNDEPFSRRAYISSSGFSHIIGYVSYPQTDTSGFYWQSEFVGKDGVEKTYNDALSGVNGTRLIERDVHGKVFVSNQIKKPEPGSNVSLTIDAKVQEALYKEIKAVADTTPYQGGAGLVMDIHTGEIIALTSYPEYNSAILSDGKDSATIQGYFSSKRNPLLNRAVSGTYTPGSIVKPYIAAAALTEGVITPTTQILSQNQISIPNPYNPKLSTIFKDFHKDNGWLDLRHALEKSSNIYFYEIGGGYQNQRGIGIANIEKYARLFGIGEKTNIDVPNEKTGTIPSIAWKAKVFPGDPWRLGDTYNTSIGQYGFQVTPIQMLRAVASIANNGTLVVPHILKDTDTTLQQTKLSIDPNYLQVIREGMRLVATTGTAKILGTAPVAVAAKTGTAQVGVHNEYINSWATGFFPYEKPRYAFVVIMEKAPTSYYVPAANVTKNFLAWFPDHAPEYFSVQ